MDLVSELLQEVRQIKRQMSEMHRYAKVTAVDVETARLTVQSEGLPQEDVPFLTMRAGEDQTYWLPSVGEFGFLIAPCGISANAIFLPGIFYTDYPPGDMNLNVAKRIFRDGTVEEIDTENSHYRLTIGEDGTTELIADTEQVQLSHDGNVLTIDGDETVIDRPSGTVKIDDTEVSIDRKTGTIKFKVGNNAIEMNPFALNLLGALIFPTGITGFQSPVGPVIFSKAATTPGATPVADPATKPDGDGNATEIPAQDIRNVAVQVGSNFRMTLGAVPFTGFAGPTAITGTLTPGTYAAQVTGTLHLKLPAKAV